ncbi:hypothetical protein NT6N_13460 [Oceaniferula spumae]|uniref:HTH gntR-type domain-containing protein n=1 Tax=Oceaniferula spumae TaxID=2979115 RepID=A0AAT9FJP9_9BACT
MAKKRTSLFDQAVSQLLEEIGEGTYNKQLPGERVLAENLGVSRPVVRSVLEHLESQGWIAAPGVSKARMILKRPPANARKPKAKSVGILVPRPVKALAADDMAIVTSLIHHCEENGWRSLVFPVDQLAPNHLERRLDELLETSPCDIWVGMPILNFLAFGLLHEKGQKVITISTSTTKWDYGTIHYDLTSATAHAFGVMLRAGRREIVHPIVSARRPPEMVERITKILSDYGIPYREDFHLPKFDRTRKGLIRLLDSLSLATPKPDGIIIQYTSEISVLLVEGWLMDRGLRYPDNVSLIQIGSDNFIQMMLHPVSHYTTDAEPLLEAAYAALDRFFTTGECLRGALKLETTYVKGESV